MFLFSFFIKKKPYTSLYKIINKMIDNITIKAITLFENYGKIEWYLNK